ncbi:MAG: cation:proton antiporter [Flavobacteriales bacterium]
MLIALGLGIRYIILSNTDQELNFFPILEVLGVVGLIMIVLEAALELELKKEKLLPILKSLTIALLSLLASAYIASQILLYFIPEMTLISAWLYATPLSILSSAIIIPSVQTLKEDKREFHIYESTFSDILGIILFYFLTAKLDVESSHGFVEFSGSFLLTMLVSVLASYLIIVVFQRIKSNVKLFLLIAVLLLLYGIGKIQHLSSLIIILIFGLVIANMRLFFRGPLSKFLDFKKAHHIYNELHTITAETAFVVRTFFFVIFGITISISSLFSSSVVLVSLMIILSIYIIRYVLLRVFLGKDILPQVFIAPRGLITILLFYNIPVEAEIANFEPGILLFVIIATSLIMTGALIFDKKRHSKAIKEAQSQDVVISYRNESKHEK